MTVVTIVTVLATGRCSDVMVQGADDDYISFLQFGRYLNLYHQAQKLLAQRPLMPKIISESIIIMIIMTIVMMIKMIMTITVCLVITMMIITMIMLL